MHRARIALWTMLMRGWLFVLRQDLKLGRFQIRLLDRLNRKSKRRVTEPGGPVVSLTTFGSRIEVVYLAIESIVAGSIRPSRLILWIQDKKAYDDLPESLLRLQARGLEVRLTESYGPHSKYFPYLQSIDTPNCPLVTADDDTLYNRHWLQGLMEAYNAEPNAVHCYRAHVIEITEGYVAPYLMWRQCRTNVPSFLHFATGCSGSIYPLRLQQHLKARGASFLDVCPMADDVWLHACALQIGIQVSQLGARPFDYPSIPGTQANALFGENAGNGGNDAQIKQTYSRADIRVLESALLAEDRSAKKRTPRIKVESKMPRETNPAAATRE